MDSRARIRLAVAAALAALSFAALALGAGRPKPDLVVSKLSAPPAGLKVGEAFKARDTVKNRGRRRAGRSTSRYYLSLDGKKSKGDVRLPGKRAVKGLGPGKVSRGAATLTVPQLAAGSYFLLACADDRKKVKESSERNNCRASKTKVAVAVPSEPVRDPAPSTDPTTDPGTTDPGTDPTDPGGGTPTPTPNAAPVLTASAGAVSYAEGAPATPVDGALTVSDPEGASLTAASASITGGYAAGEDSLAWADNNPADFIALAIDSTAQTVKLTGADSAANYQAALRAVTYQNSSATPSTAARTVTFSATDAPGASGSATRTIDVVADLQGQGVDDSKTVTEDAAGTPIDVLANDSGAPEIASASDPANGTVVLTPGGGPFTGLTYQPDANYCNTPPGTTADTFTYTLAGGAGMATVSVSVDCVNDAPVADTDAYTGGIQGTRLRVGTTHAHTHEVEVSGNVLQGDTDVDTPLGSLTVSAGTVTSAGCAGASPACANNVQMASDGTFTYDPPAGHAGNDTFTYQVNDNDTGDPGSPAQSDTETVTLTLAGPRTWYIDDSAPGGGRGVSHSPLQSLAQIATGGNLNEEDGANDRIFMYSGTYVTGIDLESGQKLLGEPHGLNVNGTQLVAAGGTKPAISSASGTIVTMNSGGTEAQDLALGNTPNGSYSLLAPVGVGAFTVADTDINNGTGGALHVLDGTPSVALGTLSSAGSTNNGVRIADTEGGTVSSSTGALSNATGSSLFMSNANTTLTLGSAISDDTGALVSVFGGSSDVTYNGTITDLEDGDGDGIAISGTSGDHNFTKSVRLSTGGSNAFSMTGSASGSLRMVPTADTNRLATTSGAALTVTDTPIHANGLSFEKIAAQDPTVDVSSFGIRLSNTGSGSLTVAGTGAADSGGVITGKSTGISLNNTTSPSFARIKLSNHGDFAIKGDTVTGFTLANSVIDASVGPNGNDANADEGAVSFDELLGTGVAITNSTIKGGWENDLRVKNDSGTLNRLTVTNTAFGGSSAEHNDSVQLESNGSAVLNATVQSSTFTSARGDQIQTTTQGTSAGDIQILSNTLTNSHPTTLGGGIVVSSAGSGDLTYAVNSNNVKGALGSALVVGKLFGGAPGDATAVGTVSGNTVGQSGVASSGSSAGSAIDVSVLGNGKHSVQVTNNTLRQYSQHGILITAGGASRSVTGLAHNAALNLTVTGNNIAEPANAAATSSGIQLISGTNSGDSGTLPDQYQVCLGLNNNTAGSAGDESSSAGRDYLLRQRFETAVSLPGYAGAQFGTSATMTSALTTYLAGRDTGAGGAFSVFASTEITEFDTTADDGFFNTPGSAACPTT